MRVNILGSAAGGGFPQWNCVCSNCRSVRDGTFSGKTRTQLQVAVSGNGKTWFLLNASPDIRSQIEVNPMLHPREGLRHSPIAGVVLTSGDLDQVLGLLILREFQQFRIWATTSLQRILREDNTMFSMLNRVPDQVEWTDIVPGERFPLLSCGGGNSGLQCTPLPLALHYPEYVSGNRSAELSPCEGLLGLLVEAESSGRLAYLPAVPKVDEELLGHLESADVVLFDGTFWKDDELIQVRDGGPTGRAIGHIPVSGPEGSLQALAALSRPRKIYVHMNNTNPMLNESGPEYREVCEAGWKVAEDGWQFAL